MSDLEVKDLLDKIYQAFVNMNGSTIFGTNKYILPTYLHFDKIPYFIKANKISISIIQYGKHLPKRITIKNDLSINDIELLIYKNFIY